MPNHAPYRPALERAVIHATTYLENLTRAHVAPTATLAELRSHLSRPLPEEGTDAAQVIDELVADSAGGLMQCAGGRFFGWVIGGHLPAALAADWITSTWDQNAALYASSPAEAVIEETCGAWLKQLFGLPADAGFALVTGCQMAHFTCLAAARNGVLARIGWDVERKGLCGAPRIRVVTSSERHGSILRAVRYLGLGSDSLVELPVDAQGQLRAGELEAALKDLSGTPTIVVLQAGDLNTGIYDPFPELIPLAHAYQAWVHVDGAFGLWAAASPRYRHLLEGVKQADLWASDGHKWLNVPYDCGYAFVADADRHTAAMSHRESYLIHADEARDQMDWTPEWSRRGRSLPTYAAIRQLGRRGIADLVERCCRHAKTLTRRIGALPGVEPVREPQINQGLVRFLDPAPGATDADHDRFTDHIIQMIVASGEAFFGGVTWRGKRCMRISVSNWQTTESDIERTIAAVEAALHKAGR